MNEDFLKEIISILQRNDFSQDFILKTVSSLREKFSAEPPEDFEEAKNALEEIIESEIIIKSEVPAIKTRIIFVVGSSGSGKTTAGFSLAARELLNARKSGGVRPTVKLISTSPQIGDGDAVSKIGFIMDSETIFAKTPDDVETAVSESGADADIIFVDTETESDIPAFFPQSEIYLALPATMKASALEESVKKYGKFAIHSVIVTKCDETEKFGNVVSVLSEHKLPVSYIAKSRNIPSGIKRAEKSDFAVR